MWPEAGWVQGFFQTWWEKAWNERLFLASQILVGLVDPISAGRIENIKVHRVFERLGFVRHVRWDAEHFTGMDDDFPAVDPELQRPVQNVSELFVVVAVARGQFRLSSEALAPSMIS